MEPRAELLDERTRPDFRDRYAHLLRGAKALRVAVSRVRLTGLMLSPDELLAPSSIRLLVTELSGLTLALEADRFVDRADGKKRVDALVRLLREGRLRIRSSPLGGWAPDFSIFTSRHDGAETLIVGPHWLDRPWPHRGPALASLHGEAAARRIISRFDELWREAHDVGDAVASTLTAALGRARMENPASSDR